MIVSLEKSCNPGYVLRHNNGDTALGTLESIQFSWSSYNHISGQHFILFRSLFKSQIGISHKIL